jgi:hypothetical protein
VLSPTSLAVLDRRVAAELVAWPEIIACLPDRVAERFERLAVTQAISQLTDVDRRLLALLWHLGARWGRVRHSGHRDPDDLQRAGGAREARLARSRAARLVVAALRTADNGACTCDTIILPRDHPVDLLRPARQTTKARACARAFAVGREGEVRVSATP